MPLVNLKEEVDLEWILLIKEARKVGLSKEEVLKFIKENGNLENDR